VVLSQAIYLENYFYLALDGPLPVKPARIEREFRQDFHVRVICRTAGLEVDSVTWSSERIRLCLIYAR